MVEDFMASLPTPSFSLSPDYSSLPSPSQINSLSSIPPSSDTITLFDPLSEADLINYSQFLANSGDFY